MQQQINITLTMPKSYAIHLRRFLRRGVECAALNHDGYKYRVCPADGYKVLDFIEKQIKEQFK